ncbi:MAG TPA: sugar transferase [Thermoanaerobaculia bacterium]|nr:sugar transferase [Thermoanaerobaculia bacterium]
MIRPSSREASLRMVTAVAGDLLIGWGALAGATYLRRYVPLEFTRALLPAEKFALEPAMVLLFTLSLTGALGLSGFYRQRMTPRTRPMLLAAVIIQMALVSIGGMAMERQLPRSILVAVPLLEVLALSAWRVVLARAVPIRPRNTVVVGNPVDVAAAIDMLAHGRDHRIEVLASVDLDNLDDFGVRNALREVEEVICVSADVSPRTRLELLRIRGPRGYLLLASHADALLASTVLGWIGDQPLVEIKVGCGYGISAVVKRALDIALGSLAALLTSPIWLGVAIAIALEDRGPILIRQLRVGRGGVSFAMWKFRSMREGNVTRAGSWLRRYRLDELPQLLNVISGDMSLVGPRPERPEIVKQILIEVPDFDLRNLVRPGIAGLAQVAGEYDTRPDVKLRYDITYMCGWSLWLDLRLLLRSVSTSLSGSGV